jgi:hypothetical protein
MNDLPFSEWMASLNREHLATYGREALDDDMWRIYYDNGRTVIQALDEEART